MSAGLLDVNVLIALFDRAHPNFDGAHSWFGTLGKRRWATCPLTINGCVRVISSPSHTSISATPAEVAFHLRRICSLPNHEFWRDEVSLLDESRFDLSRVMGPKQITDVYLLALAVARGGQLVTFDRSIPWQAVRGATRSHLRVLGKD